MKVVRASYSKTYPVSINGTWEKIYLEAEVNDGEDVRKCLYDLKKQVQDFHFESNKAEEKKIAQAGEESVRSSPKSQEETIIEGIRTCTELTVLKSYELIAKNNHKIKQVYELQLATIQV